MSYPSGGAKDVRVRVFYTDGSTFESHLLVMSPAPAPASRYTGNVTSFSLTADKAHNGQFASANISVEFGGRDKPVPDPAVLDKPLIVVKGFDVSGIIALPDLFSPTGRFTYRAFVESSLNLGGVNLSDGADFDGYDIVYVDFDNGTDYIERNAYLLERVIRWVNENKTGTQPNAMLTMSMGGLVAQYALCDIEGEIRAGNTSVPPHQVTLLITHDSPHQGANVPLSLQMALRHLAGTTIRLPLGVDIRLVDQFPLLEKGRQVLLSPAAQQMLRYQTTRLAGLSGYAGPVVAAQTSLYDTFQQKYQALLGPARVPIGSRVQPCRVVAVSNGSECGRGQPFEPYAELVRYDLDQELFDVPLLTGILVSSITGVSSVVLSGTYYLRANVLLRALPDQQQAEICKLDVRVDKTGGLFDLHYQLINYHGSSRASQLPLDSGSGGSISIETYVQAAGGTGSSIPAGILRATRFCFVPTFSALNIVPTSSAAVRANYSPGNNVGTPFINFRTAARGNELHVAYTPSNSAWMLKEIRQTPQELSCLAFCQVEPRITAANICNGGATVSINAPAGTNVSWSTQPSGYINNIGGLSGPSVTMVPTGSAIVTLTATISSECGTFNISKANVEVGTPTLALGVTGGVTRACPATLIRFVATAINVGPVGWQAWLSPASGGAPVRLTLPNGAVSGRRGEFLEIAGCELGTLYAKASAANACESFNPALQATSPSVQMVATLNGNQCMACQQPRAAASTAALYPNPARESVEVHIEAASAASPITVRLFDAYGQPRAEQTSRGETTLRLSTAQLPTGLYFVHILRGQEVLSRQQLRIEK